MKPANAKFMLANHWSRIVQFICNLRDEVPVTGSGKTSQGNVETCSFQKLSTTFHTEARRKGHSPLSSNSRENEKARFLLIRVGLWLHLQKKIGTIVFFETARKILPSVP
jgi:hypothetical protein